MSVSYSPAKQPAPEAAASKMMRKRLCLSEQGSGRLASEGSRKRSSIALE